MANDFLGKELQVGDKVVFMEVGYRGLRTGTIKRIGKVRVTIGYCYIEGTREFTARQRFNQVVKVEE